MNWSIDTILIDPPAEKGSAALCLFKIQRVCSASIKVCCLSSFAGGGPKAYCIIYTVNRHSSFAPLNVDNYDSFYVFLYK